MSYDIVNLDKENIDNLEVIGSGAFGTVYANKDSKIIYKIFNEDIKDLDKKIRQILDFSKKNNEAFKFCNVKGPVDLIKINDKTVGYTVEKVNGYELSKLLERDYKFNNKEFEFIKNEFKKKINYLSHSGILINDLYPWNVFFNFKNSQMYIIDVDSWEYSDLWVNQEWLINRNSLICDKFFDSIENKFLKYDKALIK